MSLEFLDFSTHIHPYKSVMLADPANPNSCDGIRSRVRQLIVGKDNPESKPQYSHDYAYRALIPMDKVIEGVGSEVALTRTMHVREPEKQLLTSLPTYLTL